MSNKTILILGTGDTKSDEMRYLSDCITGQGAARGGRGREHHQRGHHRAW